MNGSLRAWSARNPRWHLACAAVLVAVAILLLSRNAGELRYYPFATIAMAGIAGLIVRRRAGDALLLAGAVWAGGWPEDLVGVQFMACLILPVLGLTLRPLFATFLGASAFTLVIAGMHLKEQFAGSVLTWHDLRFFFLQFADNIGVMWSQPTLVLYGLIGAALFTVACVLLWKLDSRITSRSQPWKATWVVPPLALLMVIWLGGILGEYAARTIESGPWRWGELWRDRPVSTFLSTWGIDSAPKFRAVDTKDFRADIQRARAAAAGARQPADIVLVLQESQFNPATIAGCPDSLCALPVFGAGPATEAYGPMRVHVFGGGTWLTEFALNTGVPHPVFGAAGDFAPFNVAPSVQRSFARSLRDAGYRTVAVYPVGGGMMNARQAYAAYGYDRFYQPSELGFPGGFGTRDEPIYEAALRVLEEERKHGKPVFLMVVTIFNHAEHGVQMKRVPPEITKAADAAFADAPVAGRNVADYVWRTRLFEAGMAAASEKVLRGPRPAVVAWFGDHQPPFGGALELRERVRHFGKGPSPSFHPKMQTWYHIASNRAGPRAAVQPSLVDIAFLPGLLADAGGVAKDDWLTANVVTRERCGGLLQECRDPAVRNAYLTYLIHDLRAFGGD